MTAATAIYNPLMATSDDRRGEKRLTYRALITPLIRLRDQPAEAPSQVTSTQTDGLILKASLSASENEGGAPMFPVSHIASEELSPAHLFEDAVITPGTILVEKDASLPQCFKLGEGSYQDGWRPITFHLSYRELEEELAATGWTFFYMATPLKMTSIGFDRKKLVRTALGRVIARVVQLECNCLEIDSVTIHSFLGMRYARVSAHPRHIQKGMVFPSGPHPREIATRVPAGTTKKWIF